MGIGSSLGSGQQIKISLHKQTNKLINAWVEISRLRSSSSVSFGQGVNLDDPVLVQASNISVRSNSTPNIAL